MTKISSEQENSQRISGRTVLITGGHAGIGKGLTRSFLKAGYNVVLLARDRVTATEFVDGAEMSQTKIMIVSADLDKPEQWRRGIDEAFACFGRLDVACFNAGIFTEQLIGDIRLNDIEHNFRVNIFSIIEMTKYIKKYLEKGRSGRIVITSSISGPVTGLEGWSIYGASKAAQLGFIRSAAIELAPLGITVNAILPGKIRTDHTTQQDPGYVKAALRAIPVGKLGTPSDIGDAAVFLARESTSFITGQTLIIDGGQTLPEIQSRL